MTNYNLIKGQADWNKYLNDYMNKNYIEATEWSTTGVTAINGFTIGKDKDGYDRLIKYRILTLGSDVSAVELSGAIVTPAMAGPVTALSCVKFPDGILPKGKDVLHILGQSYVANDATMFNFNIADANTLSVTLHGASFNAGSVIYPNILYIY